MSPHDDNEEICSLTAMETDFCDDLSILPVLQPEITIPANVTGETQDFEQSTSPSLRCPPAVPTASHAAGELNTGKDWLPSVTTEHPSLPLGQRPSVGVVTAPIHELVSADSTLTATLQCSRDIQPLLELEADHGPARRRKSKGLLQYFLIGVLFAGLVTAAALAVAVWPGGALSPTDPQPERLPARHDLHASADLYAGVVVVVTPVAGQQLSGLQHAVASEFRSEHIDPSASTFAADDQPALLKASAGLVTAEKHRAAECRQYYYTLCSRPTHQFHYDPHERTCVSTAADDAQLCNHGSNRFSSWEHCRASCIQPGPISDKCLESPLFQPCTKHDVAATFWYFNGNACAAWEFPSGKCPSTDRGVHRSFQECFRRCEANGKPNKTISENCAVPTSSRCAVEQLQYPFFADMRAKGSARCANASRSALLTQRCLVGANQFVSFESCRSACLK